MESVRRIRFVGDELRLVYDCDADGERYRSATSARSLITRSDGQRFHDGRCVYE